MPVRPDDRVPLELDYERADGSSRRVPLGIKVVVGVTLVVHLFGLIPAALLLYHAMTGGEATPAWSLLSTSMCFWPALILAGSYAVIRLLASDRTNEDRE
ncbi:MAG TPA: hypothetical protein VK324_10860 [Tepidisphaeraceae bacterium]|nr:hypothetical protein [Tepidisphaeraceae bacterium]